MPARNFHPFGDGGAVLRPQRLTRGVFAVDEETGARAVDYLRRHAEDAELLIEILGLVGYGDSES